MSLCLVQLPIEALTRADYLRHDSLQSINQLTDTAQLKLVYSMRTDAEEKKNLTKDSHSPGKKVMHTVCKAIYVACQTRDGDMAYLVMKTSPSHHLCHQGKKTSYAKANTSDLMAFSEPLALVKHDQTLMQLSWMLKYYGEQRPSSCRTSTFKCVVPLSCRTSTFKCVVPSSCRTSTFKCVCAFKLQNLHLQICCAFKLQNFHLQMCCAFKLQNLHFQMCLRLQVAELPPSNVCVPSSCRTSTFKCVCALHKQGITIGMPHRYCTGSILC